MSDNHQTPEHQFQKAFSEFLQAFDQVQDILLNQYIELCEAFDFISVDDDDDGLVDEELDLSDVSEAER